MDKLNELEREVITMLLDGDEPVLRILREQLRASSVARREFTGCGFYTGFSVPDNVPRTPGARSFNFGDVVGEITGLQHGAGFLLHVENGTLDFLEGYSYDEAWPEEIHGLRLSYVGGHRNIEALRKRFQA